MSSKVGNKTPRKRPHFSKKREEELTTIERINKKLKLNKKGERPRKGVQGKKKGLPEGKPKKPLQTIPEEKEEDEEDLTSYEDIAKDDPFRTQFHHELSEPLLQAISSRPPQLIKEKLVWPSLGDMVFVGPHLETKPRPESTLLEEKEFAVARGLPPPRQVTFDDLFIKSQILQNVQDTALEVSPDGLSPRFKELLQMVCDYRNVYYPECSYKDGDQIRLVYCIHAINHVLKSRLKVLHHNARLQRKSEVPEDFRDQGLVRPKVLIILPFRESAFRVVKLLMSILVGKGGNVMNKKRFYEEYTGESLFLSAKFPKPLDYQTLFAGNTDDNFKIGISVTKKCFKLYADFYSSDIIISSPLGLRILIGAEGEEDRDYDFLASIELFIMDQSEVLIMQNWEHVLHVVNHLHLQPKESHGTDLSRVRMWALNGWSKYYMQALVFSSHQIPEISALYSNHFYNFAGKVAITNPTLNGTISQIVFQVPQVFHHFQANSVMESVEARFLTFVKKILPQYKESSLKGTLIFIPSYFDFVKLRNWFKTQELSFVHICEYTEDKKIMRARDKFFHKETHFLLYTERFHFFRRIRLRGVRHIVFYQPPTFPSFYSEVCSFLQDKKRVSVDDDELSEASVSVLYSKFDALQLSHMVGTTRATRMLASDKPVHMFLTNTDP